jgi:hypothetical protein
VYDRHTKKFIGKQHVNGNVEQLTDEDINVCNQHNFPYTLPENLSKDMQKIVVSELDDEQNDDDYEEEEIQEEDDPTEEDMGLDDE